jgi:hypothetical protein
MNRNQNSFIGEILLDKNLITETALNKALKIQKESGNLIGEFLISEGMIRAIDFYKALADEIGLEFGSDNLEKYKEFIDLELINNFELETYIINQFLPLKKENNKLKIMVTRQNNKEVKKIIRRKFAEVEVEELLITNRDLRMILENIYKDEMVKEAVEGLFYRHPEESASRVFTKSQIIFFILLIAASIYSFIYYPRASINFFLYFFNLLFMGSILFKFVLSIIGALQEREEFITKEELESLDEKELPIYSILVPVYREPKVIGTLIQNLKKLDYPGAKLDILFLFEEDDLETINKAKEAHPPDNWNFIYIPESHPQTKPKACNYGLKEARGEFLTIYDAEDMPEPDQLKKAYIAFQKSDDKVICFQSALNYFNRKDNLLTKLFTLEYSYWFDYMLPGLDALKLPIPLGGTSNHFRIEKLRELGGWDPFNVTEDADLGIRANARGYKVGILNSTTYEEANNKVKNWINQRSRWQKGYLQTFLVHNRQPLKFIQSVGLRGWFTLQIFIGGSVLTHLVAPFFWLLFLFWLLSGMAFAAEYHVGLLLYISFWNLLFGNFLGIYLSTMAVFKRKYYDLVIYALLNPIYYLLQSVAAWKALKQLFFNPFYWEKTEHGLTEKEVSDDVDF